MVYKGDSLRFSVTKGDILKHIKPFSVLSPGIRNKRETMSNARRDMQNNLKLNQTKKTHHSNGQLIVDKANKVSSHTSQCKAQYKKKKLKKMVK